MQWYEFNNGALRALKKLLESPLSFDVVEFINITYLQKNIEVDPNLEMFAKEFDSIRLALIKRVSGVGYHLSQSGKLNPNNIDLVDSPIGVVYSGLNVTSAGLVEKACDATNVQMDRLLESFGLQQCHGDHLNEEILDFVSFYLLSEAIFLCLVGMAKVTYIDDIIELTPQSDSIVKQLHRKWFANYWENSSSLSSIAYLDILEAGIEKDFLFPMLIGEFGKQFHHKIFSLPSNKLPSRMANMESIKWASKLCKLTALCLWCQLKGKMKYASMELIDKIGISSEDLSTLSQKLESYTEPDRVFSIREEGVRLVNPSMTDQLRLILNDLANDLSEKRLNDILGKFFENEHVKGYFLKDGLSEKYEVYDGMLPHDLENKKLNPDVDFILRDKRRNKYYFIQVKYLKVGGKSYISGDLDHIISGKLTKGIRQLLHAKMALSTGELNSILESRGIPEVDEDNSEFLLIHNIYNFDFCKWPSGVLSYEWNTIRNLFDDGKMIFGHSKAVPNVTKLSPCLPIEDPDEVINILMEKAPPSSFGNLSTLFETDKVKLELGIGGSKFSLSGLGL